MTKRSWAAAAAALLLAACGGEQVRTPVALGHLVAPVSAPWLTVEQSTFDLAVRGTDEPVLLDPQPSVPAVLQSTLRHEVQPLYFTDLIVGCNNVGAEVRVRTEDDAPSRVGLDLSLRCRIDARGLISSHDYRVRPDMPVPADGDYAKAFASLLDGGSHDIARQLAADVAASARRP
ncbi:hypothetical protein ASG87_03385 [Frateuria sp. Soil773]|uniref:hypothetical protein n=1 Tax=Frateuria sp. Soil773 TaxID=1736407 RepID=UPI0006FE5711|nr:hypothetical protein [Frateuria sp. Soil773]KRE89396.1 hypothetical protein ASG87_03385 [Frateuria sp. Soil773]